MSVKPEANVVLWARLYRVLAARDEYLRDDPGERIDRTATRRSPFLSEVDAALIAQATELDFLCGYAARLLSTSASAQVLDLLGRVREDRLAAIAYALPEERRKTIVRHDPYWARVVAAVDRDAMREMDAVLGDLDSFAKHMDTEIRDCLGPQIADDVMDYGQQLRRLDAGLPNTLTPDDLRGMIDSRRALAALVEAKRREHLTVVD